MIALFSNSFPFRFLRKNRQTKFYSGLVDRGDLIFYVGANVDNRPNCSPLLAQEWSA